MPLFTVRVEERGDGWHLLVKESPEHGQRNVEEQHLEDHLHLRNQEFLEMQGEGENLGFKRLSVLLVFTCTCAQMLLLRRTSPQPSPSSELSWGTSWHGA